MTDDPGATDAPRPPGTLYVVATPIGNLGDISMRALDVLRAVAAVAAEDTRMTRRIWARHGISTPLLSYHARSAPSRREQIIARLAAGDDMALVTDAGTPLVSDPGADLVAAWADLGGRVVPVPGPSAVLAALVASGLPAPRWGFEGFLPRRGTERRERLARIADDDRATVLFEAPGRTAATLRDLAEACGTGRRAALCRELTKLHEEVRRGALGELAGAAVDDPPRGEVTIVVAGAPSPLRPSPQLRAGDRATGQAAASRSMSPEGANESTGPADIAEARARVAALVEAGQSRSSAARQVARESGLPRRRLFAEQDRQG